MRAEVVFQHIVEIIRYCNLTSTSEISHQAYFLMKFLADVNLLAISCFDASLLDELVENASEILLHCLVNLDVNNLIVEFYALDAIHCALLISQSLSCNTFFT